MENGNFLVKGSVNRTKFLARIKDVQRSPNFFLGDLKQTIDQFEVYRDLHEKLVPYIIESNPHNLFSRPPYTEEYLNEMQWRMSQGAPRPMHQAKADDVKRRLSATTRYCARLLKSSPSKFSVVALTSQHAFFHDVTMRDLLGFFDNLREEINNTNNRKRSLQGPVVTIERVTALLQRTNSLASMLKGLAPEDEDYGQKLHATHSGLHESFLAAEVINLVDLEEVARQIEGYDGELVEIAPWIMDSVIYWETRENVDAAHKLLKKINDQLVEYGRLITFVQQHHPSSQKNVKEARDGEQTQGPDQQA